MAIYEILGKQPKIDASAYVFENATVIGDVTLEKNTSVWSHVSIRGDNAPIYVGAGSNIQESSVLHVDAGVPLFIGENVTVGHQAMLHGCHIGDGSLIGMSAIILNHAKIGKNCLIGAGAIIPEGKEIPDNSLVIGIAKVVRTLTPQDIEAMHANTRHYVEQAQTYKHHLKRLD
ncbi:gamma carbonic anhydrase family protein [Basilea psittacipulmonis]|uniref:Anhydrase n=1 Tax=Basilea psittacipulmonis DSM 24701 TaxID=1072685 RepID=A0A077DDW9_9BURK|nr:gamma carbonic anhydrase family protein [Basilea psittacipulmonis]AIL32331.1 anhydrase [Basilea psittacipulmonis DSM 24701]